MAVKGSGVPQPLTSPGMILQEGKESQYPSKKRRAPENHHHSALKGLEKGIIVLISREGEVHILGGMKECRGMGNFEGFST